ncbi:MAG: septum formation initiator family protein [Bacteroidetes bacterium]|nr:septum formation initiator family protein [Bacteroidota bacterium]
MKVLQSIPAWLRNKYVLTLIGFTIWMLFIDDRDFYVTYFRQRNELSALLQSKQYYEQQISATREELDQLKVNAATIEKYAREKYRMKRENEDLFVLENDAR